MPKTTISVPLQKVVLSGLMERQGPQIAQEKCSHIVLRM